MSKENLINFSNGFDTRRNLNGRPIGSFCKKAKLKRLLKDLSAISSKVGIREKLLIYQLYGIIENDLSASSISSSITHLYFIESDFGIKIGISKNIRNRLKQIQQYAPESRVLKIVKFASNFEKDLHYKFRHINIKDNKRIGTEWFNKCDELLNFIEDIGSVNDFHKYFNPKGYGQIEFIFNK